MTRAFPYSGPAPKSAERLTRWARFGEARSFKHACLWSACGFGADPRGALIVADDLSNTVWRVTPAAPPVRTAAARLA